MPITNAEEQRLDECLTAIEKAAMKLTYYTLNPAKIEAAIDAAKEKAKDCVNDIIKRIESTAKDQP